MVLLGGNRFYAEVTQLVERQSSKLKVASSSLVFCSKNTLYSMETIIGIFSESFWYVAPILVALTTGLAGLINQGFKIEKGWIKQLISWVLGAGLSVGAWLLKVITFGEPIWLGVVCLCVVVGLASNGFYDIPTIKNWINSWFVKKS